MHRVRRHMTYANVMATLAVFIALGGTALASVIITSNSQVARGTISGHKPPSGKHPNIIGGSVNGRDVANKSLTGADINESRLTNLVSGYATINVGTPPFVRNFGGNRVTSVTAKRIGAGKYNVTFHGSFPGVTSTDDVFVQAGTWDTVSPNFDEAEAAMGSLGSASTSAITVPVTVWSNNTQPPTIEDADFSVMLITR